MTELNNESLDLARQQAQETVRTLKEECPQLNDSAINVILTKARSHYAWQNKLVSEELLKKIYEIMASGPTSMNCCPTRIVFVTTDAGKKRLARSLNPYNVKKMVSAPVTAIIAYDIEFWRELPFLFPHKDRRSHFEGRPDHSEKTAFRNSSLQGAYFMIAARAVGLDVGAMSGFSNEIVDQEFFSGTSIKSNFLCNLGYADETALFKKLPRFAYEKVCSNV